MHGSMYSLMDSLNQNKKVKSFIAFILQLRHNNVEIISKQGYDKVLSLQLILVFLCCHFFAVTLLRIETKLNELNHSMSE